MVFCSHPVLLTKTHFLQQKKLFTKKRFFLEMGGSFYDNVSPIISVKVPPKKDPKPIKYKPKYTNSTDPRLPLTQDKTPIMPEFVTIKRNSSLNNVGKKVQPNENLSMQYLEVNTG